MRKGQTMKKKKTHLSLGKKLYIFVVSTVLVSVVLVCMLFYFINVGQIDTYFKRLTSNSAQNFASFVDVEYIKELRALAETPEYQALRTQAEDDQDETLIQEYLEEKGLWEKYEEQRDLLDTYLHNMKDIKYLYIVAWGDADDKYDMYILDDKAIPIYETGYYELREKEFAGVDPTANLIDPVISHGDWGWLCSGYAAVRDDQGFIVCHVGCDVGMNEIMKERRTFLYYLILSSLLCVAVVLALAIFIFKRIFVNPLKEITEAMEKFNPTYTGDYEESGVINLDIKSGDEIGEIYEGVRSMQIRIVDYINDITEIKHDIELAENNVKNKEAEIGIITREAYKDSLTGVGNKTAYAKKSNELNKEINKGFTDFAVVMVDINGLKTINDNHGHSNGDEYIKGCCHTICEVFKHSPVYRIGGDEFVVILTNDDFNDREERLKELRQSFLETGENENLAPWLRFSASAGMAEFEEDDENVDHVFSKADRKMYEEKTKYKEKHPSK